MFLLMGTLLYYEIVEVRCLGSTKTAADRIRDLFKDGRYDDEVSCSLDEEATVMILISA